MAYSAGNIILDDEYNTFATGNADGTGNVANAAINSIWASGADSKGYGQTSNVAAVSAGTTITATQWANLFSTFSSISSHTGVSVTSITNPIAGDTIDAVSTFSGDLSTLYTNSANAAASGSDITTNGSTVTTSSWDVRAVLTQVFTWANADSFRYFWNAGGMLRFSYSRTGGTTSDKNSEWSDLLTQSGTIALTGLAAAKTIAGTEYTGTTKIGGSGTANVIATATGAYDLTTSNTILFKQFADTSPYTTNYIQIEALVDNASTPTSITITTTLEDAAADTIAPDGSGSGDALDVVDGTLTGTHVIRPPSTTYLTASWGTPSMNSVAWSLTS